MVKQKLFHRTEAKIYLILWIVAVFHSIYHFIVASQIYFQDFHDFYNDFSPGWPILDYRKRDKADFEWETIQYFFKTIYPILILYLVVSELMHYLNLGIKRQQYFQVCFTLIFLTYYMGYRIALLTILQPLVFYMANKLNSKIIIWTCNLISLGLIAMYKNLNASEQFLKSLRINHFESYMNILLLCWLNLKCTSFYLSATSKKGLMDFLPYCFYFPTIFTGPFIPPENFVRNYERKKVCLDVRIRTLGLDIFRCVFWFLFVNFSLHFVYVNATSFQIVLVTQLDLCSLCGYGYLMGQFFHIKYVVLYGLSTSLAAFENIPVPSLPRCIGRVHLYSDMWKYFDPGLYTFLKMNIYIPSQKLDTSKILSSFLCFFFVYLWHGIEDYIFIWAALNFFGVASENLANILYEKRLKQMEFIKNLSPDNLRRLKCAMAAPLLAMSSVSNFYFFAGKEVGDVFVHRVVSEPFIKLLIVVFMLYCCSQVSTELRNMNANRMGKAQHHDKEK